MNSFERITDRPVAVLLMDEEEYAGHLRDARWSEHAIEIELRQFREYHTRFKAIQEEIIDDESGTDASLLAAVQRKRNRGGAPKGELGGN
jgi:hypothetical protein